MATNLEKYPERQTTKYLGKLTKGKNYQACCLGELHLCAYRIKHQKLPFIDGRICTPSGSGSVLSEIYRKYGLNSPLGAISSLQNSIQIEVGSNIRILTNLAAMNDNGVEWPEIAKIVRKKPELFFTKSV